MGNHCRDGDVDAGTEGVPDGVHMREASNFVREVAGRVALELAAIPEGRAAGLSVEVSLDRGVELHARIGHELRVFVPVGNDVTDVAWERRNLDPNGLGFQTRHGTLGDVRQLCADDLRVFMTRWLAGHAHDG